MSKLAEADSSTFSENTPIRKGKDLLLTMCTLDSVMTRKPMLLVCLIQSGISPDNIQQVPCWEGYQCVLNPVLLPLCKIGYCPMIGGSCTDFTTSCTVLKHAKMVSNVLELYDAVITFDISIIIQGNQIRIKFPEEFSNIVIRHGEFLIALNY